jgi:hypothetical protein
MTLSLGPFPFVLTLDRLARALFTIAIAAVTGIVSGLFRRSGFPSAVADKLNGARAARARAGVRMRWSSRKAPATIALAGTGLLLRASRSAAIDPDSRRTRSSPEPRRLAQGYDAERGAFYKRSSPRRRCRSSPPTSPRAPRSPAASYGPVIEGDVPRKEARSPRQRRDDRARYFGRWSAARPGRGFGAEDTETSLPLIVNRPAKRFSRGDAIGQRSASVPERTASSRRASSDRRATPST